MSKKELSTFEYEEKVSTKGNKSPRNKNKIKYGITVVLVLVLCGISFGSGIAYQNSKKTAVATTSRDQSNFRGMGNGPGGLSGGPGGFGNGQRPNIGEVSAVSSDSITIQNVRSNSTQTFKITSSTSVQNDGTIGSISDIKTGDTVLIIADSSDTSTASQIMLNPNFRGPQPSSVPSTNSQLN